MGENPTDIRFICNDDSNTKWVRQGDSYVQLFANGKVRSRIPGKFLPDPHKLYEARLAIHPQARKPTTAVYAMWEDWTKDAEANSN